MVEMRGELGAREWERTERGPGAGRVGPSCEPGRVLALSDGKRSRKHAWRLGIADHCETHD